VDSVLAKVQAAGSLLEARWSVSTVCHANLEPLAFGAPCSRPNASMVEITVPTTPRAARVVIERYAATATAASDA
jgi:hypothetical protein